MKAITYLETNGMKVVPIYRGNHILGFDVENAATGEVLAHRKLLQDAERFVIDGVKEKESKEDMFRSAADINAY
ncbi:hypothetical protein ACFLVM_02970 [Chloroflexota bacterium]